MPSLPPLAIGVCSWSLNVTSVSELKQKCDVLGTNVIQIACGDPHHASWKEGDDMPRAALDAGFVMTCSMLGFPGEDYSTPQTIQKTGGFGDPSTRPERLERFSWALQRTKQLGLSDMMFHSGFVPAKTNADYKAFLATLGQAADRAADLGITCALETGQETADHLLEFIHDLARPNVKVNFDPANMLLYDMGEPLVALRKLGKHVKSVHVKDAKRPAEKGTWGTELPLGQGDVGMKEFVQTLKDLGYTNALIIERSVADAETALKDVQHGKRLLESILKG